MTLGFAIELMAWIIGGAAIGIVVIDILCAD